jgi:hypothetical protein
MHAGSSLIFQFSTARATCGFINLRSRSVALSRPFATFESTHLAPRSPHRQILRLLASPPLCYGSRAYPLPQRLTRNSRPPHPLSLRRALAGLRRGNSPSALPPLAPLSSRALAQLSAASPPLSRLEKGLTNPARLCILPPTLWPTLSTLPPRALTNSLPHTHS